MTLTVNFEHPAVKSLSQRMICAQAAVSEKPSLLLLNDVYMKEAREYFRSGTVFADGGTEDILLNEANFTDAGRFDSLVRALGNCGTVRKNITGNTLRAFMLLMFATRGRGTVTESLETWLKTDPADIPDKLSDISLEGLDEQKEEFVKAFVNVLKTQPESMSAMLKLFGGIFRRQIGRKPVPADINAKNLTVISSSCLGSDYGRILLDFCKNMHLCILADSESSEAVKKPVLDDYDGDIYVSLESPGNPSDVSFFCYRADEMYMSAYDFSVPVFFSWFRNRWEDEEYWGRFTLRDWQNVFDSLAAKNFTDTFVGIRDSTPALFKFDGSRIISAVPDFEMLRRAAEPESSADRIPEITEQISGINSRLDGISTALEGIKKDISKPESRKRADDINSKFEEILARQQEPDEDA